MEDDRIKRYKIIFSQVAAQSIRDKAEYISLSLKSPQTAYRWYTRIRKEISEDLSTFPFKYPEYGSTGKRLYIAKTDIVVYSVDEGEGAVYIEAMHTRGKNLLGETP